MRIAVAQINTKYIDIENNIEKHKSFITKAARNSANIILFPELSLTSYHRYFASDYICEYNDIRLGKFEKISCEKNIIIVFGAPITIKSKIYIASIVQYPNGNREVYYKNNLHEGEEEFFDEGDNFILINIAQEKIALGICYDIEIQEHIEKAVRLNATIYAASIFYTKKGIEGLQKKIKNYVNNYKLDIAISNYTGEVWNIQSGGESMYWSKNGDCIGRLDNSKEAILFCSKEKENWMTEILYI